MRHFVFIVLLFGVLSCERQDSNEQRISYQAIQGIDQIDIDSNKLKLDSVLFSSGMQVFTIEGTFNLNDSLENYRLTFNQNPLLSDAGVDGFSFESKSLMRQLDTCYISVFKNGEIELTWIGENGRLFISDRISEAY